MNQPKTNKTCKGNVKNSNSSTKTKTLSQKQHTPHKKIKIQHQ